MKFVTKTWKKYWILLALVIGTFAIYNISTTIDYRKDLENGLYRRLIPADDVIPNTFLPYLIIEHKTIKFDAIFKTVEKFDDHEHKTYPYFLYPKEGSYYSIYPIIPGIMNLPIFLIPILLKKIPELTYHENILKVALLGRIGASFYASLSVGIFYLILNELGKGKNDKLKWIFTIFYALGTGTWSVSSRGMWLHTFSQLFLGLAVLFLLKGAKRKEFIPPAGLILGLAVLTRPTNVIFAFLISIYVFLKHKKSFTKFLIYALPTVVFLLFYNKFVFGGFLKEGYGTRNDFNWSTPLSTSLMAYLFSPARSWLFISPPLVFGYIYIGRVIAKAKSALKTSKAENKRLLYLFLGVGLILEIILFAKWYTWDGAPAFGNRMLTDFLPIFGVFAYEEVRKYKKAWFKVVLGIMISWSIYVHANAVIFRKSRCGRDHTWNFYCLMPPREKSQY